MRLEQIPERAEHGIDPGGFRLVALGRGFDEGCRCIGEKTADDAVPGISAGKQGVRRTPVAAIADREAGRRSVAQAGKLAGKVHLPGQRHLDRRDVRHIGKAAQEAFAERKMRGRGIVVDAERQVGGGSDRGEMPEYLLLGQRCVGNRRK
jgi:hypothetical protein